MDFKDQLSKDLSDVFMNGSEFALSMIHRPSDGHGEYPVPCIFDATNSDIEPQGPGFAKVQTRYVRVMAKEADFVSPLNDGDNMVLGETVYKVVEAQSDGTGVVTVVLHEI